MRKLILYPLAGLATAGVLAVPQVVANASTEAETIRLTEKIVKFTELDVGKRGLSQGDSLVYRGKLLAGGKVVGSSGGECVSIAPKAATVGLTHCVYSLRLAGGVVTTQGFYDVTKPKAAFSIVGGTGRYRGASGVLEFTTQSDTQFALTLRLD